MRLKIFKAWAIDLNSKEGHGFAGRYFFGVLIPDCMEGCETALFKTRQVARDKLQYVRQGDVFPNAQVRRVEVTIETIAEPMACGMLPTGFLAPRRRSKC